jgi:MraZ protein
VSYQPYNLPKWNAWGIIVVEGGRLWGRVEEWPFRLDWNIVGQMLLGEFEHTIDDKGRITVPAKFRARLAAGLVVTKGIDPCLWLYPTDVWNDLAPEIKGLPMTDPTAREFRRQVFGGASNAVPDKQGRVNLPTYLRNYANIDKQAMIIGLYDHCEIWNPVRWRERQEYSDSNPEGRAEHFANLGI